MVVLLQHIVDEAGGLADHRFGSFAEIMRDDSSRCVFMYVGQFGYRDSRSPNRDLQSIIMNLVPTRSTEGLLTISNVLMTFVVVVLSWMGIPCQFDMKDSHGRPLVLRCHCVRYCFLRVSPQNFTACTP